MTDAPSSVSRLALRGITKRDPTGVANANIDLTAGAGEFHALLGEATQVVERCNAEFDGGRAPSGSRRTHISGRETLLAPRVMVATRPARDTHIGASVPMRDALDELRARAVALLHIAEEREERFTIRDRIAVNADGSTSRPVPTAQTDVEQIGMWMSGPFDAPAAGPVA